MQVPVRKKAPRPSTEARRLLIHHLASFGVTSRKDGHVYLISVTHDGHAWYSISAYSRNELRQIVVSIQQLLRNSHESPSQKDKRDRRGRNRRY